MSVAFPASPAGHDPRRRFQRRGDRALPARSDARDERGIRGSRRPVFGYAVRPPRDLSGHTGDLSFVTGNVWEWNARNPDHEYPYGLHGGSWLNDLPEAVFRAACRFLDPSVRDANIGFRVASPILFS